MSGVLGDLILHFPWQIAAIVGVGILALGALMAVAFSIGRLIGQREAPEKARKERDAAQAEREEVRRERDEANLRVRRRDGEIERLNNQLGKYRGATKHLMTLEGGR